MKTTIEQIRIYAPDYADLSDAQIQMAIDDSFDQVQQDQIDEKHEEQANRYLACHLLFMQLMAADGGVQSATSLQESQTMFDWSKDGDPYFQLYQDQVDAYGNNHDKGLAMSFD